MPRVADPTVRESLLRAGRTVLGRGGLRGSRVADITTEAGVSKGAFYLHFDSKGALFREVALRFLGALEEHARRRAEQDAGCGPGPDPAAELRRQVGHDVELLEMLWRNREILRLLDSAEGTDFQEQIRVVRRGIEDQLLIRLGADQHAGRLRGDLDLSAVSDLILGAWERMAFRLPLLKERPDFHRWAATLGATINWGVCKPEVRS